MLLNVRIRNLYPLPNRRCWNTSQTSNRKTRVTEKKPRFVSARHISDDFMSMRRIDLGSGSHMTENQDEIRKNRRHVQRKRFQFLVCVLCIAIVLISPQMASAQDTSQCSQHCWNKISQDVSFTDGMHVETITEEQDCKDTCFNNETCTGVYWGFNPTLMNTSCWLQMPVSGTPASLRNANYWNLTTSSDDCYAYCWLPKWINVQTTGGVLQKDINTEGQCKSACSKDNTCNGVDWDTSRLSCRFLFSPEIKRSSVSEPIHHWEILRNLPVNLTHEGHNEEPNVVAVAEKVTVSSETVKKSKGQSVVAKKPFGPSVGETNVGKHRPASAGNGPDALIEKLHCPNYMTGIITLTALMSVCFLIIILLIAYILFLRLELNKLEDLLYPPEDRYPSYESFRHSTYDTEASASEASGMEY